VTGRKAICCAVYTRKSTEHNLDLEFNSLDAQREACEAYIKSQIHEGWVLVPDHYDDGGISGGTLDRPDLQRLLSYIRAGKVDIVVVYKVDRLTRSLTDFAKLVELFDSQKVSFVSITQAFNTTSSMGRLTLNILLSFAQFEREVIGERVRDKIAASKAKGLWMGGNVPLGYVSKDKKLVILPEEAEAVRYIFQRYLAVGAVGPLMADLRHRGIRTKRRERSNGTTVGGIEFGKGHLTYLLKSRVYVGEIAHRGRIHAGDHAAIIDKEQFEAVQAKLQGNTITRKLKLKLKSSSFLLTGLLFDSVGNRMSPSHTVKKGVRYRYYVSQGLLQNRDAANLGNVTRVPAPDIEEAVTAILHQRTRLTGDVAEALRSKIEKIVVRSDGLEIYSLTASASTNTGSEQATIEHLPWRPKKCRLEKGVAHDPIQQGSRSNQSSDTLLSAIANARRWLNALVNGASMADIAKNAGIGERQARTLLNLAFLSPHYVQELITGARVGPTVTDLASKVPLGWAERATA
jgi:DNA invertase Pin-like site-specific DNA recombinase